VQLREHFTGEFLSAVPLDAITDILIRPPLSHEDLVVIEEPTSRSVPAQIGGLRVEAFAEADPPHRLTSLQLDRLSQLVTDERVAAPPAVTACQVPAGAMAVARETFVELGLSGLVMAGADTSIAGTGNAGESA